ncbi:MAG: hypothetical protein II830_03045, partial [Alphaproteobacteria bacterium]|nr:hypothetical protein [Alphaproteobacteria bacterium]
MNTKYVPYFGYIYYSDLPSYGGRGATYYGNLNFCTKIGRTPVSYSDLGCYTVKPHSLISKYLKNDSKTWGCYSNDVSYANREGTNGWRISKAIEAPNVKTHEFWIQDLISDYPNYGLVYGEYGYPIALRIYDYSSCSSCRSIPL